ncbi:hypothetical protein [Leifsonia sp. 71-9]|uniref:VG15 protein n=1 Tax=Leifsonia sp. 71-9 TaxID=1895934 RepID=UPI0025B85398|nr:hypothetical protein [Leifsonia sp. 71-9]
MALPTTAVDHYRQQQAISVSTAKQVERLWRQMGVNFDLSWSSISPDVFAAVIAGQTAAAAGGLDYVPAVLEEQGITAPAVADVNPARFAGGTRDGRPLESLLAGAVYESKTAVGQGYSTDAALRQGSIWLSTAVLDAVRDANRQAVASGYTVRPKVQGWVRMLNPPSCKFCITLAGKFFRWNQGFQSHNRCDCRHIPTNESVSEDLTVDPYKYFHSLDEKTQNQLFGKNDAEAIRSGGDIYRVVNVRSRGLSDDVLKNTAGRNRGWQARRWDSPSKMTIDDIFAVAKNRDDAIRLMETNGFITGAQNAGGNLIGNVGFGYAGQLGRGGTRKGATRAYQKALVTGNRDLLEPATQTAAERRLHNAYLVKQAVDQNRNPFGTARLTPGMRKIADDMYAREIGKLDTAPQSVRELARLLHIL